MSSSGYELYKLSFEISPVILVNGIASQVPGQMLPIVALTQAADFTLGILNGDSVPTTLDKYFAHWKPLPGTTLISNQIGQFPFANQSIAANAIIVQPLNISLMMNVPVQTEGGYTAKLATMTVLQQALSAHNLSGGTYTIATPSQIYTNCLLALMRDVSGGESKQVQHTWQLDFIQPLITINQATQVYNSLMNKIAGGLPVSLTPSWSGVSATVGAALAGSTGGATLLPSAANLVAGLAGSE
ncbi:hypothetical protein R69608_01413 [Paraburkholderia nemoris]|uniref:hypothetical protein n=1 Tax=Paraburkholderia nemoris TaxID=2793076 RepID=UPI00191232A4|nr:hypothetical protein [Paraburkholderia nemoris]MBK5148037.1 hypothetical protein [Burkholderia sp. R-69608]CAE6876103.1 hypothetical protein R69608_01413 [Paraburkholderia nemoris]